MDADQFGDRSPGRLIRIDKPGARWAFLPDPLPPDWVWPDRLWPMLMEAREQLKLLEGVTTTLDSPNLLLRPLQKREAIKSSTIEGTFATAEEMLLFELQPRYPTSEADPANAWREVHNYSLAMRAWETQDLPISLRLLRVLHSVLMDGVRGGDKTPGKFRDDFRQIGMPARFVPPPPTEVPRCLDELERYAHKKQPLDPLVKAFLMHYQFEAIRPFRDGNGRVGRLLLAIMICQGCGLSRPWLYLSAYFQRHKNRYMDSLYRISTEGAWEPWIEFCLRGTIEQAHDAVSRCRGLLAARRDYHRQIQAKGGSLRLAAIVDRLCDFPVIQISTMARDLEVTYPTARADIDKLLAMGILIEMSGSRPKTFLAERIVQISYSDPGSDEWPLPAQA